jgi:hypothetical protein
MARTIGIERNVGRRRCIRNGTSRIIQSANIFIALSVSRWHSVFHAGIALKGGGLDRRCNHAPAATFSLSLPRLAYTFLALETHHQAVSRQEENPSLTLPSNAIDIDVACAGQYQRMSVLDNDRNARTAIPRMKHESALRERRFRIFRLRIFHAPLTAGEVMSPITCNGDRQHTGTVIPKESVTGITPCHQDGGMYRASPSFTVAENHSST